MKNVKYFLVGTLLSLAVIPSNAQTQDDAIIQQVTSIINSGAADANKQVVAIEKANKKNYVAILSIGKAYLACKNYDKAIEYADKAIKVDSKKGDAYVLKGNVYVAMDNGGEAATWFQQAIYFDPTCPDGYRRYAQIMSKTDPAGAVQTLEELRAKCPDYPVDLIAADIYSSAGKPDQAIEYYNKVDKGIMKDYELSDFATNLFLRQKYDESLAVAEYGHNKFPRNASFNRLMMFNNTDKKNFDAAVAAGDRLFNASDSAKISTFDMGYISRAQMGAKKYDDAIASLNKMAQMDGLDADALNGIQKNLSDCYKEKGDYAKSAEYYKEYMKNEKALTAYIIGNLASIYVAQATDEKSIPEAKAEAVKNADAVYADMQEKFASVADYALQQRAHLPFFLDPEDKAGNAKPHYEKLVEVVLAKSEQGNAELKKLKEAYNYLQVYYLKIANDKDTAKQWAEKMLSIDPENAVAKAITGVK